MGGSLLCVFALYLAGCGADREAPSAGDEIIYTSETPPEDCVLCGDGTKMFLSPYWGQNNVGIVSLNTFEGIPLEINRYAIDGTLIEENTGYMTMQGFQAREDSFRCSASIHVDRGYATCSLNLYQDETLDPEQAASYLCENCLNEVMEDYAKDGVGVGLIHFETKELCVLGERYIGFGMDDFYISCTFPEKRTEDGSRTIRLVVFYAPLRYDS